MKLCDHINGGLVCMDTTLIFAQWQPLGAPLKTSRIISFGANYFKWKKMSPSKAEVNRYPADHDFFVFNLIY